MSIIVKEIMTRYGFLKYLDKSDLDLLLLTETYMFKKYYKSQKFCDQIDNVAEMIAILINKGANINQNYIELLPKETRDVICDEYMINYLRTTHK